MWDVLDQEISGEICPEFYEGTHAAILMFDLKERNSYKNIPNWHRQVVMNCENIPMVLVGNKIEDANNIKIKQKQIIFHRKKNLGYYNVSAKANYQIEKVFLFLMRKLTGDPIIMIT